nr:fibronectin type III-like domain-contianing protein [Chloroflexota bacterium]
LELCGFRRIHLAAGECRTVAFELSTEQVAHRDAHHRRVVEPGTVRIHVGHSSAELPLSAELQLVGPVIELAERHHYVTPTSVE